MLHILYKGTGNPRLEGRSLSRRALDMANRWPRKPGALETVGWISAFVFEVKPAPWILELLASQMLLTLRGATQGSVGGLKISSAHRLKPIGTVITASNAFCLRPEISFRKRWTLKAGGSISLSERATSEAASAVIWGPKAFSAKSKSNERGMKEWDPVP